MAVAQGEEAMTEAGDEAEVALEVAATAWAVMAAVAGVATATEVVAKGMA